MRVDDEVKPDMRVRFENVSGGENFYYQEKLCVKGRITVFSSGTREIGVFLETGEAFTVPPETLVIPARARVTVELYGRFS